MISSTLRYLLFALLHAYVGFLFFFYKVASNDGALWGFSGSLPLCLLSLCCILHVYCVFCKEVCLLAPFIDPCFSFTPFTEITTSLGKCALCGQFGKLANITTRPKYHDRDRRQRRYHEIRRNERWREGPVLDKFGGEKRGWGVTAWLHRYHCENTLLTSLSLHHWFTSQKFGAPRQHFGACSHLERCLKIFPRKLLP